MVAFSNFSGGAWTRKYLMRSQSKNVGFKFLLRRVGGAARKRTWYAFSYQKLNLFINFVRFATTVPHREILFQNDAYTAKGTVQLRVNEFGVFYVFVDIDRYNRVSAFSISYQER